MMYFLAFLTGLVVGNLMGLISHIRSLNRINRAIKKSFTEIKETLRKVVEENKR